MDVGVVREFRARQAITHSEDVFVRGLQILVDFNSEAIVFDTCGFEGEALHVGKAARGDEHHLRLYGSCLLSFCVSVLVLDHRMAIIVFTLLDQLEAHWLSHEMEIDSVFQHLFLEVSRAIAILTRKELTSNLKHGDLGAKAGKALTELAANRTAAKNYHGFRKSSQVENGLGRVVRNRVDARHFGNLRPATSCNASLLEIQGLAVYFSGIGSSEFGVTEVKIDSEVF